jgi:hypothetical protein
MSQQGTEQNASAVRGRLHVDTLHAQYELANGSSFLQLEQRFQNDRSALILTLACVVHGLLLLATRTWFGTTDGSARAHRGSSTTTGIGRFVRDW